MQQRAPVPEFVQKTKQGNDVIVDEKYANGKLNRNFIMKTKEDTLFMPDELRRMHAKRQQREDARRAKRDKGKGTPLKGWVRDRHLAL